MSHGGGVAIYIKEYLKKAKEELWKLKYFTMQKCNLQKKNPLKETQNPSRDYNSITTQVSNTSQNYPLSEILIHPFGLVGR